MRRQREYNQEGYDTPSLSDISRELEFRNQLVDESLGDLYRQNVETAEKEHEYRMARARAYLQLVAQYRDVPSRDKPTVDHFNAMADLAVERERFEAKLAEGKKEAAVETARSRRGQLSAVQTLANAVRAEIEFVRQNG